MRKFFALLLLASTLLVPAACTVEADLQEQVGTSSEPATCTCPPANPCGAWKCQTLTGTCTFVPGDDIRPGSACETAGRDAGRCAVFTMGSRGEIEYLDCCTGCTDRDGKCQSGTSDTSCGVKGGTCKSCGTCGSCDSGACEVTVGVSCSTGSGSGRCISSGVCCTGCIDDDTCYVDAVDHCGKGGGSCDDCTDTNGCTADACSAGDCKNTAVEGGTSCNDDNVCTTGDSCSGTSCGGIAQTCDDNNVCTTNDCDAEDGCQNLPTNEGGSCNDFDACTVADECDAGECEGAPLVCNDGNPCTDDSCDPNSGCVYAPRSAGDGCDDGNPCTSSDVCVVSSGEPIKCQGTGASIPDCGPCEVATGSCGSQTCTPKPDETPCTTGTLCAVGETCGGGICGGGLPITCDDGNPCTTNACDDDTGCVFAPDVSAAGDACSDGSLCTFNDVCTDAGECEGTAVDCAPINDCYNPGTCDDADGTCLDRRKQNGTECGTTGTCDNGQCIGDGVVGAAGQTGEGGAPSTSGGSGGEPSAEGGSGATSAAGDGNSPEAGEGSGAAPSSGGSSGRGAGGTSGSTSTSGTDGDDDEPTGELYVREPGGCAVSNAGDRHDGWALVLVAAAAALAGRRKRSLRVRAG